MSRYELTQKERENIQKRNEHERWKKSQPKPISKFWLVVGIGLSIWFYVSCVGPVVVSRTEECIKKVEQEYGSGLVGQYHMKLECRTGRGY
jgi:hypothetical protein